MDWTSSRADRGAAGLMDTTTLFIGGISVSGRASGQAISRVIVSERVTERD